MAFLFAVAGPLLSACGQDKEMIPVDASAYQIDLESLAKARILFGHQSVGRNLLEGLSDIARQSRSPLRIVPLDGTRGDNLPGVFHAEIGKNLEPIGKIEAFTRIVHPAERTAYDVALMKFCYVDLSGNGLQNPHALIEEYAKSVAAIRRAQPRLRLVHVTIPLTAAPSGWKTPLKRLLGRAIEEDEDNRMRNTFNIELRKRFAGEPIFDLAAAESTLPDGQRSYFMHGNEAVYTLAQGYTSDGGHLNEIGRQRVAAAFVRAVAQALRTGR